MPTVTVVDRDGRAQDIPVENLADYQRQGYTLEGDDARAARDVDEQRSADASGAEALLQGGLRGATFGLSDVAQRALGGEEARRHLESLREFHPTLSTVGEVGGTLATGGATAGRLGAAVADRLGGGLLATAAGGVTEGATYGVGQGVSDLATSADPLTAEHIASVLTSNALLGGSIGGLASVAGVAVQKGLQRAADRLGEAAAVRTAIDGVPDDLVGLDDGQLADAYKGAKAAHADDVAAERSSLQDLRTNQRAELGNGIRDLHNDLATERPVFRAVTGEDVEAVPGVKDAQIQLAKSYKSLRGGLDSELSVARDPSTLMRPLEMRQSALEKIQDLSPDIRAKLTAASDGGADRLAALDHVDGALADTKAQIAAIRELKAPVAGARLTALESGPSARMTAIEDARAALKRAPDIGLLGEGAKAGAFAGATALAHAIPGVGIAAPFVGKAAGDAIGKLFERGAVATKALTDRTATVARAFAGGADKLAPIAIPTATAALDGARFGPPAPAAPDTSNGASTKPAPPLVTAFRARAGELLANTQRNPDGSTTMRPEARQAMAARLDPIRAVNPLLADQIETVQARRTTYLAATMPKRPDVAGMPIGPVDWRPPDLEMRAWARRVRATEDPSSVEERLARGVVTPEEGDAYRAVFPERYAALQAEIVASSSAGRRLSTARAVSLYAFSGVPTIPALAPSILRVLQGNFAAEPGSVGGARAPATQPMFGKLGSLKSADKPTPAQARASGAAG